MMLFTLRKFISDSDSDSNEKIKKQRGKNLKKHGQTLLMLNFDSKFETSIIDFGS